MGCSNGCCDINPTQPKPCPICGGPPLYKINTLTAWIRCADCGFTVSGSTAEEVIDQWNGGPHEEPPAA